MVLAVLTLAFDQGTKVLALNRLEPGEYHPVVGQYFGWQLVFNPGAAFSFATGATWIFTIAAVLVTVVILIVAPRVRSMPWAVGLGLLLGGNLGNLIDRLTRDPGFGVGHVVDFLNYAGLFIGNVADIAIVVAAPMLAVLLIRGIALDGTRHPPARAEGGEAGAGADGADDVAGAGDTGDVAGADDDGPPGAAGTWSSVDGAADYDHDR